MAGGINTYGYANLNSINYTDPSGLHVAAGALLGIPFGPPGVIGGIAGGLVISMGGYIVVNKLGNILFAKPQPGSKPKNCPPGTIPIDQVPGLDKEKVHAVKDGIGARPNDWTGVTPDGNVITGDSEGNAENHGPIDDYLP